MKKLSTFLIPLLTIILLSACGEQVRRRPAYNYSIMDKTTKSAHKRVEQFLQSCLKDEYPVKISRVTRIDSVVVNDQEKNLDIYLNKYFAYIPLREENTFLINEFMKKKLGRKFRKYSFIIYSNRFPINQLIPNLYRKDPGSYDFSRMPQNAARPVSIVRNLDKPWLTTQGLQNRNIALWHSHGWYYEQKLDRWEWQRARLFQTVEDIGPISFTIPYIIPMLENAGANVFLPRERDFQVAEVIVDNDSSLNSSNYLEITTDSLVNWQTGSDSGFAIGDPPYSKGENPFQQGTYRTIKTAGTNTAEINWVPEIPGAGEYSVYISYISSDSSVSDARYTVYHTGGKTEFLVNQKIGGGTWIHLGKFKFDSGFNPETGKVVLTNQSDSLNRIITADGVRFGGGMGNIERNGTVSGRPRFVEAARYYMQYAGINDTLVFSLNDEEDDYRDDYQSRGEWVNYLKGAPFGPNKNRQAKGLGIPIDLSLAFHTDAGITKNDTVIGTLMIYSTDSADSTDSTRFFPDGMSRLANRDFGDILQTQLVEDIRAKYDPVWNRRSLWDSNYSESFRPNVPAALLELLSHQNFLDVKFFHDPQFRFDVSRSIYKAMLKFIATQFQFEYMVQPLPVTHFQTTFSENREITLKWQPTLDPLEETAVAQKYVVYTRIENNNFDNGVVVDSPEITIFNLRPGVIYSFKVTALNGGGESFPSEILSVCRQNEETPVLIINGFDRISGPATIETDQFSGFANFWDQGVPDKYDLGYTGTQFNFNPESEWLDDDAPGFGASYGNYETKVIPGNSFDYPYIHGKSLRAAGRSFVSVSDEVIMDGSVDITGFKTVDLILGEEKETARPKPTGAGQFKTFPESLKRELGRFCQSGGNLFLSGAYIGTDLFENKTKDNPEAKFGRDTLKYFLRTGHAAATGAVFSVDTSFFSTRYSFEFNTGYHPEIYITEAPDAIEPADTTAKTILRYSENNISAAVAHKGDYKVIAFGFPFETILNQDNRDAVMKAVLNYFRNN